MPNAPILFTRNPLISSYFYLHIFTNRTCHESRNSLFSLQGEFPSCRNSSCFKVLRQVKTGYQRSCSIDAFSYCRPLLFGVASCSTTRSWTCLTTYHAWHLYTTTAVLTYPDLCMFILPHLVIPLFLLFAAPQIQHPFLAVFGSLTA